MKNTYLISYNSTISFIQFYYSLFNEMKIPRCHMEVLVTNPLLENIPPLPVYYTIVCTSNIKTRLRL